MSFAAGMGAGIGAGMGAGIAIGIATGEKQARAKIQQYALERGAMLHDTAGKPVDWDEFLDGAVGVSAPSRGWKMATLAVLTGLLVAGVALAALLWWG